jgi:hypothetical protein
VAKRQIVPAEKKILRQPMSSYRPTNDLVGLLRMTALAELR